MALITIDNVEVLDPAGNPTRLLDPFGDPFVFRLTISFGSELNKIKSPVVWSSFEIIEFSTEKVLDYWRFSDSVPAPGSYWKTMSTGTADQLHLNWTGSDIFGIRGAAELFTNQGAGGLQAVDGMDVSEIHWFRVKAIFGL